MATLFVVFVGGVLPAVLWGVTAIFQKLSAQHGTSPAAYLAVFGAVLAAAGVAAGAMGRNTTWTGAGLGYAGLAGVTFALGTGLITLALARYGVPLARLAPLWSCNVLVTVAISAWLLNEAAELRIGQVLLGTGLIIAGALVVTSA